jgi:nicotinate dehydrogenase subunit A
MSRPSTSQTPVVLRVNGRSHALNISRDVTLLHVLRNDLALNGPKFGCGLGECGACLVLVDGIATRTCVLPVARVEGREILTLEGLGSVNCLHPIQQAFITAQAAQCGYCLNGMIIAAKALLDRNPDPSDSQVRQALKYNLCRCGTHIEILQAVRLAAQSMRGARSAPR